MKKLIVSLLFSLIGIISVQAQNNTLLVYGNVNIESQKTGNVKVNSYTFAPGVGYQWTDNWTGGLNLSVGSDKTINDKTSTFSVGPFVRYTQPLAGIFALYGQLNANYLSTKVTDTSFNGVGATLFAAIGVNLKNSFALNFTFGSLSFASQKFDRAGEATTSFHLAFGSGAGFGISKNFGLKK